jgi:hypothetical protein
MTAPVCDLRHAEIDAIDPERCLLRRRLAQLVAGR